MNINKPLLLLFLFAGLGWAELPKEFNNGTDLHVGPESNNGTDAYIYTSTKNVVFQYTKFLVLDNSEKIILKIDKDGDIFLRGKWIGWDRRLRRVQRNTKGKN